MNPSPDQSAARELFPPPPTVGSIWQGRGMTVRVLDFYPDGHIQTRGDVKVERLTGKSGLLKKPSSPGLIPLRHFTQGQMRPFDASRDDPWTRAIRERYVDAC